MAVHPTTHLEVILRGNVNVTQGDIIKFDFVVKEHGFLSYCTDSGDVNISAAGKYLILVEFYFQPEFTSQPFLNDVPLESTRHPRKSWILDVQMQDLLLPTGGAVLQIRNVSQPVIGFNSENTLSASLLVTKLS